VLSLTDCAGKREVYILAACGAMFDYRYVGHVLSNVHVPGSDPIWLDNVVCTVSCLDHLSQCNHSRWVVHNCTHHQDVSIACYDRNDTTEGTTYSIPTTTPSGKTLQCDYTYSNERFCRQKVGFSIKTAWISEVVSDTAIVTIETTNSNLYTGCRLVSGSMALNDI